MDSPLDLILPTLAAFTLPGIAAWYLARRHGLAVFWASLIAGALIMLYGWFTARPTLAPDVASRHTLVIYFVLLPAFMSMVFGAIVGAWQHRAHGAP
ncbi:hypothetical protein SAMN04487972_11456 [Paracoccus halophilus]|nr:hypothetical protein [Paracoccus halophilus]SFA55916.1 hypothetical protein SAMN04487972_11456 [Paracoccus halophilus]